MRGTGWVVAVAVVLGVMAGGCGEGDEGSATMRPGENCLACHTPGGEAGEVVFSAAGTVYLGDGSPAVGLDVQLTDANSQQATEVTNSVGNFHFSQTLTPPFDVSITDGTTTVSMTAAPEGGCNSCHTAGGAAGTHITFQ